MQLIRLTLIAAALAAQAVTSSPVPVAAAGVGALVARDAMPAAAQALPPQLEKRAAAAEDDGGDGDDNDDGSGTLKLKPRWLIPPGYGTCRLPWCR